MNYQCGKNKGTNYLGLYFLELSVRWNVIKIREVKWKHYIVPNIAKIITDNEGQSIDFATKILSCTESSGSVQVNIFVLTQY